MAGLATSIAISMVLDDMLKDDGGVEAMKLMSGEGYKRESRSRTGRKMGGAIAKATIKQAVKQGAKQVARQAARKVTKQTVKRLAVKGAKELAKGATVAGVGYAADRAMTGGRHGRRRRQPRQRRGRQRHIKV